MMFRCASTPRLSGKLCDTNTRSVPSWASRARSSRAASRISVPGSAPGAPPSSLMPGSARARTDDGGDPGPVGDQLQRHVQRLAGADQVQRHIHAARRGRADPVHQAVAVGHRDGAQLAQEVVPRGGGRGDDGGAAVHRELDCHDADSPGRAVHQHRVARAHAGGGQQMPGGDPGDHQPGGLGPVQRVRLGHQRVGWDDELSGVGAGCPERDDLIARPDRAGRADRAGPATVTTPEASEPSRIGSRAGSAPIIPLYCFQSTGLTPAARTWMSASPGPGSPGA